jgi:hypothetical protein
MARRQEWQKEDPAPAEDDDAPRMSREELTERLVRHLTVDNWRTCREGACRRHRACVAKGIPCWDNAIVEPYLHSDDRLARAVARITYDWRPPAR